MASDENNVDKNKVIIDLFKQNLPGNIGPNEFVQVDMKNRLVNDIKQSIQDLKNENKNKNKNKNYQNKIDESGRNLFFIDGTRGAGKSTFLNKLVDEFNLVDEDSEIKSIGIIDPTKLPNVEPILVTVIAKLNAIIEKCFDCSKWDENQSQKTKWQKQLRQLSKAIKLLNSKEYTQDFFDESIYIHQKLGDSYGGQELAHEFDNLLGLACEILNKEALLLALDDIDTKFDTGWDVLESIRKHFGSPKLIIIITGDLRLYSQLIRGEQYKNYSEVLLKQDISETRVSEREHMVEHLEQQYLLKLIPVQRRYILNNLKQITLPSSSQSEILVKTGKNSDTHISLTESVKKMLSEGLNLSDGSDLDMFVNELLSQPIRLVIKLLEGYHQEQSLSPNKPAAFSNVARSTMLSSIYKAGLHYDSEYNDLGALTRDIFNFTLLDGDTNTGFYLRPQSESEYLRNSAIYLSSRVSHASQENLSNILHIMLVGCGSVTLFERLPSQYNISSETFASKSFKEDFFNYLGLGRNETLTHWASRASAVTAGVDFDNVKGVQPGVIRLNRSERSTPLISGSKVYSPKHEENPFAKLCASLAFNDILGRNTNTFISIFNLIGSISEVSKISSTEYDEETITDELKKLFSKLSFITTNTAPPWSKSNIELTEEHIEDSKRTDDEDENINDFELGDDYFKWIINWLNSVKAVQNDCLLKPNSILLGKIWTRLFFNLTKIAELHKKNISRNSTSQIKGTNSQDTNAAKIMRFNVVALLNAILFEESIYHPSNSSNTITLYDRNNPVTSVDQFVNKLTRIEEQADKHDFVSFIKNTLPIFFTVVTCPFIYPFLFASGSINSSRTTKKSEEELKSIIYMLLNADEATKKLIENSIIKGLNSASISGPGKTKPTRKKMSPAPTDQS